MASPICLRLLAQVAVFALSFALLSAGRSNEARMAMIATTTNSSINVNAPGRRKRFSTHGTIHPDKAFDKGRCLGYKIDQHGFPALHLRASGRSFEGLHHPGRTLEPVAQRPRLEPQTRREPHDA